MLAWHVCSINLFCGPIMEKIAEWLCLLFSSRIFPIQAKSFAVESASRLTTASIRTFISLKSIQSWLKTQQIFLKLVYKPRKIVQISWKYNFSSLKKWYFRVHTKIDECFVHYCKIWKDVGWRWKIMKKLSKTIMACILNKEFNRSSTNLSLLVFKKLLLYVRKREK